MRRPSTVPVASRDRDNARRAATPRDKRRGLVFPKQDLVSVVILLGVILLVLFAIAAPLRNYYEGRAEIARAQESITQLEAQKRGLESDIAMFENEEFMKQEARRRLGVMEEGESAWRILDPRMTAPDSITTSRDDIPDNRSVAQVLWDSLRVVETETGANEPPAAPEGPEVPEAPDAP